ncbi:a2bf1192-d637-470b-a05d-e3496c675103 [Sclerotinia trifoliorum]|uniref:A2bf1192-d637-470b-a05d-e3496c675103 n=1 Tax=Sclerotinia trifoliorum TaxID=28548 RepID=A0A8H2VW10_9HELO|nr:a2bf1192-d637-470b-a05d-e3496c675103 [Sclerotinia trifoliorum]
MMPPRCSTVQGTLTPFLYPFLCSTTYRLVQRNPRIHINALRRQSTLHEELASESTSEEFDRLNPPPSDYSRTIFADKAKIDVYAGAGGHGCISFLREKYIAAGPANGGDGGTGGNIYIQAVRGETSLHKLARRRNLKAGRGKNGQGKTKGGERGTDIIIEVPVGTIVRELDRHDPAAIEEARIKTEAGKLDGHDLDGPYKWDRERWLLYPAITAEEIATAEFPSLPKARKSNLAAAQVKGPISLDLSMPMERPLLLAAGAVGGLGNPHFVTKQVPRPKFATKGEAGLRITLELELKLLADVGLVGLPNAGKSTLLRAMSNSRTRVGDWEFTTLEPNIGTVVIDDNKGRPLAQANYENGEPRTNFTIADIPGLVEDAHLDRGLGISFLRHVERARVLAFVVDLGRGNAVEALKGLWRELAEYERMKIEEEKEKANPIVEWTPFTSVEDAVANRSETIVINTGPTFENPLAPNLPSISNKPWFVVASKADLPGTQDNFQELKSYLEKVAAGKEEHPSRHKNPWTGRVEAIPISAIHGHGVEKITEWTTGLLDG